MSNLRGTCSILEFGSLIGTVSAAFWSLNWISHPTAFCNILELESLMRMVLATC
jgi:hypothetical protein